VLFRFERRELGIELVRKVLKASLGAIGNRPAKKVPQGVEHNNPLLGNLIHVAGLTWRTGTPEKA
jgi:hypothetical protein